MIFRVEKALVAVETGGQRVTGLSGPMVLGEGSASRLLNVGSTPVTVSVSRNGLDLHADGEVWAVVTLLPGHQLAAGIPGITVRTFDPTGLGVVVVH